MRFALAPLQQGAVVEQRIEEDRPGCRPTGRGRPRRQRPAAEPRRRGLPAAQHASRTLPHRFLADGAAQAAPPPVRAAPGDADQPRAQGPPPAAFAANRSDTALQDPGCDICSAKTSDRSSTGVFPDDHRLTTGAVQEGRLTSPEGKGHLVRNVISDSGNERDGIIMAKLRVSLLVGALALAGAACEAPVEPDAGPTGTQAIPLTQGISGPLSDTSPDSLTNRSVLEAFYHATGGPDWDNNTNWLSTQPLNTWYGVTADSLDQVKVLYLPDNNLADSLPVVLRWLRKLEVLVISGNENMSGEVPLEWATETQDVTGGTFPLLWMFHAHDTGICALPDTRMRFWLDRISDARVSYCKYFYLNQSVQSFDNPVPLVAGRRALLRVFVTADNGGGHNIPGVSVTVRYNSGSVGGAAKSPGSVPIPTDVDESDLSRSVNFNWGFRIEAGMSMSIEVDPDGDIPDSVNIRRRIPTTGMMNLDVRELDDLELTLVPFLYRPDPDTDVLDVTSSMARDPQLSGYMEDIRELHPFSDYDVTEHDPVLVDSTHARDLLNRTVIARAAASGTGYWMGTITPVVTSGILGIVDSIGGWNSFATPLPRTIAHELGHNIGLRHAPCPTSGPNQPGGTDPEYPYPGADIGAWGFDMRDYRLVPDTAKDFMSYCRDYYWVSDYHYAKMIRQLLDRDAHGGGTSARTIIVWGGVNADGDPYLESSFFMDATVSLPARGSEYRLRGMTAQGEEAFSFSFDMPDIGNVPDGQSAFVFAVPVSWAGELGEITLSGRGGSFTLNRDTDQPLTILYDDAGKVRAILNADVDEAMRSLPGVDVRPVFSRGIPR